MIFFWLFGIIYAVCWAVAWFAALSLMFMASLVRLVWKLVKEARWLVRNVHRRLVTHAPSDTQFLASSQELVSRCQSRVSALITWVSGLGRS